MEESNAKDKFHTLPPPFPEGCDQIALWKGDITSLEIDAIVNAANTSLMGGGGGNLHKLIIPLVFATLPNTMINF